MNTQTIFKKYLYEINIIGHIRYFRNLGESCLKTAGKFSQCLQRNQSWAKQRHHAILNVISAGDPSHQFNQRKMDFIYVLSNPNNLDCKMKKICENVCVDEISKSPLLLVRIVYNPSSTRGAPGHYRQLSQPLRALCFPTCLCSARLGRSGQVYKDRAGKAATIGCGIFSVSA